MKLFLKTHNNILQRTAYTPPLNLDVRKIITDLRDPALLDLEQAEIHVAQDLK